MSAHTRDIWLAGLLGCVSGVSGYHLVAVVGFASNALVGVFIVIALILIIVLLFSSLSAMRRMAEDEWCAMSDLNRRLIEDIQELRFTDQYRFDANHKGNAK